jgi:subfamily B ATP-binding cassette protein MsbA
MASSSRNLWRLLGYVKPYWVNFALATGCGMLKLLIPVGVMWVVGQSVDVLAQAGAGRITADAAWARLWHFLLIGGGLMLAAPVPVYLRSAIGARTVQLVMRNLRCDLYAHMQKLSHSFYESNRSGSLTNRIIWDIESIQPFIARAFVQMWMSIGLIAVVLGYFFSRSVVLGCISLALIPFQVLIQRAISWKVKKNAKAISDRLAHLAGSTQEKLAATTIVKAFTHEEDEVQRFSDDTEALVELGAQNSRLNGMSEALMQFLRLGGQLLLAGLGGWLALHHAGGVTVGVVTQFVLMQGQLYMPFDWLNEMQVLLATALGATDRIFAIFDTEPEIADRPGAVPAPHFRGEIRFDGVAFTYPGAAQPVFTDLTLHVPARATVALVGPSGSGKTTVTNLVNRFYDWEAGKILIDGRDLRDYTVYSLRSQIGLVPQAPLLFSGTVLDNILYGRPDATLDEVREAARRAYADEFILRMDDGYDTLIGERGMKLSGGQQQRISIARAFLKDPAILVLDEATSALDAESEHIVQLALENLMRDRTTLVIAHRLATVRHADLIAVIDAGRVVEQGTHDTLVAQDGLYAALCRRQFTDGSVQATS